MSFWEAQGSSAYLAGARLFVVLASLTSSPRLRWIADRAAAEPLLGEVTLERVASSLVRPRGRGACATVVLFNGVTERGRQHPGVRRLAIALARAGFLVLVPDLHGLARGEISEATVADAVDVCCAAVEWPEARAGRIGLLGLSVGTTVALLAAEDERLSERISAVTGIAPYTDFANIIRLATTGSYRDGADRVDYPVPSFLQLVVARSLAVAVPGSVDRAFLTAALADVDAAALDPLAELRQLPRAGLSPAAQAVLELTLNRDPDRFDALYAALPAEMRAAGARLSPLAHAERLRAPVELLSAPRDKYFPLAESQALARAAPTVRVTVARALAHAEPRITLREPGGLGELSRFGIRALRSLGQ